MMHLKLQIKFKKLCPNAVVPYQATPGSAGFDLTAISVHEVSGNVWKYHTGIAVEIPEGYVGLVFPRSSIYKAGMRLTNSVGVIDSDYRGEITAVFDRTPRNNERPYSIGDRICQLVIIPIPKVEFFEVAELTPTERGLGGYGSTGR